MRLYNFSVTKLCALFVFSRKITWSFMKNTMTVQLLIDMPISSSYVTLHRIYSDFCLCLTMGVCLFVCLFNNRETGRYIIIKLLKIYATHICWCRLCSFDFKTWHILQLMKSMGFCVGLCIGRPLKNYLTIMCQLRAHHKKC